MQLTPPAVLGDHSLTVELGGRTIELVLLEPGHTDTDLAVHIPDARTWFLGDAIEESGPPMFGSGSYPLNWANALTALLPSIQDGDTVVPGHGHVVTRGGPGPGGPG